MRTLLHRADAAAGSARHFLKAEAGDFQQPYGFPLSRRQGTQELRQRRRILPLWRSRCRFGQFFHLELVALDISRPAILIDLGPPRNRKHPGQQRLARAVSMPRFVDSQPEILQQILGERSVSYLRQEKLKDLRAQAPYERCRGFAIRLLITAHERFYLAGRPFTHRRNLMKASLRTGEELRSQTDCRVPRPS